MPATLLSIASIAREMGVPESTLHYWKNRFAEFLPSVGRGRQKRFRPEALDIFRTVAALLRNGHTTQDIKDQLATTHPVNVECDAPVAPLPVITSAMPQIVDPDAALKLAEAVGVEVARVVGEKLAEVLARVGVPAGDGQAAKLLKDQAGSVEELRRENASLREELEAFGARLAELGDSGGAQAPAGDKELEAKLAILESELVRLRKDRRDMEKFLLEKIESLQK